MKYTIQDKEKERMVEFKDLKPGDVFSFFDITSLKRTNHSIYMKLKTKGNVFSENDIVDLTDGHPYIFAEKKRVSLNDPDELQANRVHKLETKLDVIV